MQVSDLANQQNTWMQSVELVEMSIPNNNSVQIEEVITLQELPAPRYAKKKYNILITSAPVFPKPQQHVQPQQQPPMNMPQQQQPYFPQQQAHPVPQPTKTIIQPTGKLLAICNLQRIFIFSLYSPIFCLAITDEQVSAMLAQLESSYFSQGKMDIIQKALANSSITCKQAKQIIDQFHISFEKKQLIKDVFQHRLADPQQLDALLTSFEFELDQNLTKQQLGLLTINFF